ncbi:MAG: 2-aminoethylphosphonate--pyruvate transaminase [bacterium]|nr:2-aminoethylphosphonate--pyruvate transaminase [bacterium]
MTERGDVGTFDSLLFTPGPLTTSSTVKAAMLRDVGSRDTGFIEMVRDIRRRLVELAGVGVDTHTAIPMQGSGTFGLESVLSSAVPPDGKLLAVVNGAYGRRIVALAEMLKIATVVIDVAEDRVPSASDVDTVLAGDSAITHVSVAHCETTTGIINPVVEIGEVVHRHGRQYFVDAMSSFGAVPLSMDEARVDYLVSSANKCIEGVPGFSFVIARTAALLATKGHARSLSLDLLAQYEGLEATGQFRFTPPTHVLRAFHQALDELDDEDGVVGRGARYRANYEVLVAGTRRLGLVEYLDPADQGYIITSFHYPEHDAFTFGEFYERLGARNFVIYPGKVTAADCFRIGTIGRIFPEDVRNLLDAIGEVLTEMGVELPVAAL